MRSKTQQPTRPAPATTPEERRRIRAEIAREAERAAAHLTPLATRITDARDREARARELLKAAVAARATYEGDQLAVSGSSEHVLAGLRRQLAEGAPAELEILQQDVAVLVEHARTKADTRLVDGYQGVDGRRPVLADSNTGSIGEFTVAARCLSEQLQAERYAEAPSVEQFGPFVELVIPAGRFHRGARHDDPGSLIPRAVAVPAALAALYDAIGGVTNPRPELSPADLRETVWAVERAAQRRFSGEPWR